MGLIRQFLGLFFGGGRNVVKETAEVFRENAEAAGSRDFELRAAALRQMSAEFGSAGGPWGRFVDGLNRLPRPMMAFGVIGLFVSAMADPIWFAERMQGLALVPEDLWIILGIIVAFYFGGRELSKQRSASMQAEAARILAQAPQVVGNIAALRELRADSPGVADTSRDSRDTLAVTEPGDNPALDDWRARAGG